MKKAMRRLFVVVLSFVLVFSAAALATACGDSGTDDNPTNNEQTVPVKVKDGEAIELTAEGASKTIKVADYITANGNTVTVSSSAPGKATATLSGGVVTVAPVAAGTATVTLTCGSVTVTFAVTVAEKQTTPPEKTEFTVSLNGVESKVDEGGTFTLPETFTPDDPDFEFVSWNIVGDHTVEGNTVTVNGDLTITAETRRKAAVKIKDGITLAFVVGDAAKKITVSDYITTHGNTVTAQSGTTTVATAALADGVVTVNAVAEGTATVTVSCGSITVTFAVTVSLPDDSTPRFKNGTISFDLYEKSSDSYAFEITPPAESSFTYVYTVDPDTGVTVEGNTLTYTATETVSDLVLTVSVTATDATLGEKTTSFTVTVNVTDTTPVVQNSVVADETTHDLHDGALTIDLTTNIDNPSNYVGTYKVNDAEVDDPAAYVVTGSYTDTATDVELAVEATFGTKTVSYTYNVKVIDTTEYRIKNGGFENDLADWTKIGEIGNISSATAYWTNENDGAGYSFNADGKFFSAYEPEDKFEKNIGTLTSSTFKVSQNRIITFKLGGAQHDIFVDVVDASDGTILARYGNSAWAEGTEGAKSGCTLIAYKATLPQAAAGKTVYIRVIDGATSYYGVLFCDSFVTYYSADPTGDFVEAVNITARPATVYDIYNGGFESDLAGWTISGGDIGAITSDKGYWNGGDPESVANEYGKEGNKLFSWWSWNPDVTNDDGEKVGGEVNREGNMGTLTSNMFMLKSGKYVSFKFGGGGNRNVFIELVNAQSGSIIAVFRNDNIEGGKLKSYNYKVDELTQEALCYFRVVDNAISNWGCFTADDFCVNLDEAPSDSVAATNRVSEYRAVLNGSFESGLDDWTMIGDLGAVVETEIAEGWYQTNELTKDGSKLFTFYYNNGTEDVNVENNTGIIRSSAFILGKNGIISFRFGAAHNRDVYINVYTTGGQLLATFRNNAYTDATVMVQYYYQFDNAEEISCYFEAVDNATGDYGCIVMDDFRVNLAEAPADAVLGSALTKAERDAQ